MRCSEIGLRTQEMLTNNRNTAVKPTAFEKQSMKPHRGDDSQTRAALGQQHGRSYRRFANTGRSGPTTRSIVPTIHANRPLRANNTGESVHYLGTPDDSKRCESSSIFCGNTWPLPVVLAGRSEILHSRHPELGFQVPQMESVQRCDALTPVHKRQSQTVGTQPSIQRRSTNNSFGPQQGQIHGRDGLLP
jgi:hypothetical protein